MLYMNRLTYYQIHMDMVKRQKAKLFKKLMEIYEWDYQNGEV
jgi:hypothetical protein